MTVLIILDIISIIILALMISTLIVNIRNYKYYRRVYKTLKNRTFISFYDQIHGYYPDDYKNIQTNGFDPNHNFDYFIWFKDDDSLLLSSKKRIYIFDHFFTWFDFYTLYWQRKYFKWLKTEMKLTIPNNN